MLGLSKKETESKLSVSDGSSGAKSIARGTRVVKSLGMRG
jgi:hypothetical protein